MLTARRLTALLLAVLVAGACGDDAGPGTDEGPSAERIAAVATARQQLGPPAAELASATATVGTSVLEVYAAGDDASGRLAAIDAIRAEVLPRLRDGLEAARSVELAADPSQTEQIRSAWEDLTRSAAEVAPIAVDDLDHLVRLLVAEVELLELAEAWQTPGSRSEQLERLGATAASAGAIEASLGQLQPLAPCSRAVAHRLAAARHVAAASTELHDLVASQRGEEFDARRAELGQDPLGLATTLAELDGEDLACWEEQLPTSVAVAGVLTAADGLEAALNPPDVTDPD